MTDSSYQKIGITFGLVQKATLGASARAIKIASAIVVISAGSQLGPQQDIYVDFGYVMLGYMVNG